MTGRKIAIGKASVKDGRVVPAKSRAPKTIQKAQIRKTNRKVKAWEATGKVRGK